MPLVPDLQLSPFAADVLTGLTAGGQKKLLPKYFYDDLGSKLFEAITLIPEYGLTRADARVLAECAPYVAQQLGPSGVVAELGSGSGKKTSHILQAIRRSDLAYHPIDVSSEALQSCAQELHALARVKPIHAEYFEGLAQLSRLRRREERLLLLFVGSSIGNFEAAERGEFLRKLHGSLQPGDLFLLGADLVKDVKRMIAAYDDPTGVTAAFNLNVLGRINRELSANFDLRCFAHQARWNAVDQRIEMHLQSLTRQSVSIRELQANIQFEAGETIWTESSHKFTLASLEQAATDSGFTVLQTWTDQEWPLAETLWQA
jgi:L-histidine Nalpha-methyltransferase